MSNDDKCPCVDGLPDPCTLCGAPADGVCEIDTLVGWKHRAQRAEAEARQLREAIEDRLRQVLAVHGQFLGDWDEWTSLGALEGYNGLTVTARTALAHLHGRHDDSPLPTMHCVLCETFRVPAVAEGAEE